LIKQRIGDFVTGAILGGATAASLCQFASSLEEDVRVLAEALRLTAGTMRHREAIIDSETGDASGQEG
jgi:hypothetical protein